MFIICKCVAFVWLIICPCPLFMGNLLTLIKKSNLDQVWSTTNIVWLCSKDIKVYSKMLLMKSSENNFILLPAFWLILFKMLHYYSQLWYLLKNKDVKYTCAFTCPLFRTYSLMENNIRKEVFFSIAPYDIVFGLGMTYICHDIFYHLYNIPCMILALRYIINNK